MAENSSIKVDRDDERIKLAPGQQFYDEVDERDHRKWRRLLMLAGVLFCIGVLIILIVAVSVHIEPTPTNTPIHFPASPPKLGVYDHAAAAVDAGVCSQIARDIMQQQGGSAVDAAIAGTICTGTFNMYAAGIGGGFVMTIWNQTSQEAFVLNSREVAPLSSTKDMFNNGISSTTGPYAIAVPGEIAGYWAAHQRFGRVSWRSLFEPTIKICREGLLVSPNLARGITIAIKRITQPGVDPKPFGNLLHFLSNPKTGSYYVEGDTIFCSKLADTLDRIAQGTADDFYNGTLAADVLADLAQYGSPITQEDLSSYTPIWPIPINMSLENTNLRMIGVPPPASGAVLGMILNILAGYKFSAASSQDTLSYHRFVEALKFGYGQRMLLGDQDFEPEVKELVQNMISPAWSDHYRSLIDDAQTHPTSFYLPSFASEPDDHGTCQISVVDAEGNAVSITSTINAEFGSGVMGTKTGIIFNNQMDDFSKPNATNIWGLPPSPRNFIAPGKRPQSSMDPSIFLTPDATGDKFRVALVIGGTGGSRIISGTAYVATRLLWFEENPKEAIDALRLHDQLLPETLNYEPNMPLVVLNVLRTKGHVNQTEFTDGTMSIVQAVQILADGKKLAFSDYRRRNALADGY